MKIFPAIDIIGGKAVRLTKGNYDTMETFGDPSDFVKSFAEEGATCLHMVDLDGAKSGQTDNFSTVEKICKLLPETEIGGGIRDIERIRRYLDVGVTRVILGTAAVKDPSFLDEAVRLFGDAIAVGVDSKNGFAATDGWEKVSQKSAFEFCASLPERGVKTVIFTDVSCDGMMKGTNLSLFSRLSEIPSLNVIASGGITYYEEIKALSEMNLYGAILGKALYKDLLSLKKAILIAEGEK